MIRRPPRSTQGVSSAASDVYKRQVFGGITPQSASSVVLYTFWILDRVLERLERGFLIWKRRRRMALGKTAIDALAWSLNIFSSVAIVMVNKQLMSSTGYGFRFATTLCGLHFFCTAFINLCVKREKSSAGVGEASSSQTGLSEKLMETEQQTQKLPLKDLVFYVVVANMSIIGLNISLMLNTIGFYQVCKLAQIPTMCILEASFLNKKFSRKVVQAIIVVLAGVAVATVSDVEMNVTGTVAASVGVLSTSAQQILVGHLQKKHNVTSNFLLAKTSLWMAASMLVFGPIMDTLVTGGENVFEYEWTSGSLMFLAVSCGFAVLVTSPNICASEDFRRCRSK